MARDYQSWVSSGSLVAQRSIGSRLTPRSACRLVAPAKRLRPLCDTAHDGLLDSRRARRPCNASGTKCELECPTFATLNQRHQLVVGLHCHDHLLSRGRQSIEVLNTASRSSLSISPDSFGLSPVLRPSLCRRVCRRFRSSKDLSHEVATCGRDEREWWRVESTQTRGATVLIDDPIAGSDLPRPDAIGHEVECSAERVCHPVPW
jgi:hypothetical protein